MIYANLGRLFLVEGCYPEMKPVSCFESLDIGGALVENTLFKSRVEILVFHGRVIGFDKSTLGIKGKMRRGQWNSWRGLVDEECRECSRSGAVALNLN